MRWFSIFLFFSLSFSGFTSAYLRVYVWDSGENDLYGHVGTPKHYVSLWPATPSSPCLPQWDGPITTWKSNNIERVDFQGIGCVKAKVAKNRNYDIDKVVNGRGGGERQADATHHIKLKLTQKDAIEAEWERLDQQQLIWFSLGTSLNKDTVENCLREQEKLRVLVLDLYKNPLACNCASLIYHLLKAGGLDLNKYVIGSPHDSSQLKKIFTLLAELPSEQDALDTIFFEKIIYPSKMGYMANHRMVDLIKTELNYT